MNPAQFKQMLDRQEEQDNEMSSSEPKRESVKATTRLFEKRRSNGGSTSSSSFRDQQQKKALAVNGRRGRPGGRGPELFNSADAAASSSYLDQDARIPFDKLKKVRKSFVFSTRGPFHVT